jgi:hypothetical protein
MELKSLSRGKFAKYKEGMAKYRSIQLVKPADYG